MSAPTGHIHVSERQPGRWVDCEWTSGVMFARAEFDKSIPATLAEAHRIRTAAGALPGGTTARQLHDGLEKRYNFKTDIITSFDDLWARLDIGVSAAVQGEMGAFPAGHQLRRWDPAFTGGHCVFIARMDNHDRVWWDDPLAPSNGKYNGQWATKSDLARFVHKMAGAKHIIREMSSMTPKPITSEAPATMTVKPQIWYDLDGTTKLADGKTTLTSRYSPFEIGDFRAMYATIKGVRRTVLVVPVDGTVQPIVCLKQVDVDKIIADTKAAAHVVVEF